MTPARQNQASRRHIISLLCGLLAAPVFLGDAAAQGSRFDSLMEDASRFLERQGKTIERQLRELTDPEVSRNSHGRSAPPSPTRNPRRAKTAPDAETSEPVEPPEGVETSVSTVVHPPVPLPARNPLHAGGKDGDADKPMPPHPSEIEVPDWTGEQIARAKSECETLLAGHVIDYSELDPIREGRCGAPYPIKVSSIGAKTPVRISPPAKLTCTMAAALSRWLDASLQPLAVEYLGSPVARLRNVSSYACRNRYNNLNKRISEHALANALDVAAVITHDGNTVSVLSHWRKTEIEEPVSNSAETPVPMPASGTPATDAGKSDVVPTASAYSTQAHERIHQPGPLAPETVFLRVLHADACELFGTVIGPEANKAHRDHFHLDMKKRKHGNYCE